MELAVSDRLTDSELESLEALADELGDGTTIAVAGVPIMKRHGRRTMLRAAIAEIRERRAVDRNLVNARSRNARWQGQKRRR